jgi:virginiamycin B lyase
MSVRAACCLAVVALTVTSARPVLGQGRGQAVSLPEGSGQELVQSTCARCHGLNMITRSWGYTESGWRELFSSMIDLPDDDAALASRYLAEHFPVREAPEARVIPGPVSVEIREWMLPTRGQRPHDPLAARDGSVWWTGQFASRLGRLDPSTGSMVEFVVPEGSQPHGLVEDADGNIWFTAVSGGFVGRFDARTGEVTRYPVPEGERGPHTPIFDQRGTLFFTLQSGSVGRLDPATGVMTVRKTPTPGTYPYGIQVNSRGVPWYVDFRGNRIGSVDPRTMEITEHELPDPEARPRRIALGPDDVVWYTDYARGYLGRYDPATGEQREWASPGGPESAPYGIATIGSIVWYSESGVRKNTLVRFDPSTERFQTWVIPSGGGVVRNMMASADGKLVLALSGVNRVAVVQIRD